ncbi:MAG: sensor histidine kinase, partial [Myxococcota bacterium]
NLGRLVAYGLVTPVWPPTGVALAALLLGGLRLWPGVALGAFVTVGLDVQPVPVPILLPPGGVLAMTAGNTLEAVLGAWLIRRYTRFAGTFDRVREVVGLLVFAVGIGASLSATVGASTLLAVGAVPRASFGEAWFEWWVGNALAVLVVTPLLTSWISAPRPRVAPRRVAEFVLMVTGLGLAAAHSVLGAFPQVPGAARETYLLYPFLVWAALRFGPRAAATMVAFVSLLALTSHAWQFGIVTTTGDGLLRVQVCVGVIATSILLLAASIDERQRACVELSALQLGLREEVARRTAELQEANRRLKATNGELAVANRDLESFAWNVAHDLRAPVRAVSGFAALLKEEHAERLDPDALALLTRISRAANQMGRLIDGLLEVARLGRRTPAHEVVDMEDLAARVAEEVRGVDGPTIVVHALPPCQGDPALLRRAIFNLVQNAVKYTRGRPDPRIEIGGVRRGREVEYWVRDNGVGFDMRYVGHLFRVFHRLHGPEYEGTGVGLAIVRRIVELHGGRVWAEGREGKGATFHFRVPAKRTNGE